jgi:hypothetical protein
MRRRHWLWMGLLAMMAGAAGADEKETMPTRCYELRTYYTVPGRLPNLNARFRNHTVALLEKHGMKLIGFWTPVEKDNVLIYLVEHASREAAQKSWAAFRADPDWLKARKASEEDAGGGSLTEKVESVFMAPTDYSAMK